MFAAQRIIPKSSITLGQNDSNRSPQLMGNIRSKLLFSLKCTLNLFQQMVKGTGQLIDFICSAPKFDTAGKIVFKLNLLYGLCDPADRTEGSFCKKGTRSPQSARREAGVR